VSDTIELASSSVIYTFSPAHPPAVEVSSGTVLRVQTRDAYDLWFEQSQDMDRYMRERAALATNPATGPIAVRGAEPGDGLSVTIERIDLGPRGYVAAVPGIGVLGDSGLVPQVGCFDVRPDGLFLNGRLRLPLRPMLGVIGVAPEVGEIPCSALGYHGGNLDFRETAVGTTVHLPVRAAGGLLALGDAHANMGACETYSGVNIVAAITIRVERVVAAGWERPWFETANEVMVLGVEDTLEAAIHEATRGMAGLLRMRLDVSHTEAVMLTGAACDIRLGQAGGYGVKVSAYAACPKSLLEQTSEVPQ
jgi:amidase